MGIMATSPDVWVAEFLASHRIDVVTAGATHLMNVGISVPFMVVSTLGWLVMTLWLRTWRLGGGVFLALSISNLLTAILKAVFGRERPPDHLVLVDVESHAFPSTHASATAAVAVAVVMLASWTSRRTAASIAAVIVAGIGFCLVYLGSHWMSDVLVGWAMGALIGWVVARALAPRPVIV